MIPPTEIRLDEYREDPAAVLDVVTIGKADAVLTFRGRPVAVMVASDRYKELTSNKPARPANESIPNPYPLGTPAGKLLNAANVAIQAIENKGRALASCDPGDVAMEDAAAEVLDTFRTIGTFAATASYFPATV